MAPATTMTDDERHRKIHIELTRLAVHYARTNAEKTANLADIREMWSERAAIREYLGALRHRRNAELHGMSDALEMFSEIQRRRRAR